MWREAQGVANGLGAGDQASEHFACGSGNWGDSGILDQWDMGRSPCWPSSLNMAASWDVDLMARWSLETANEFGATGRGQLGPGINVARFAWNGRLGEYHSGEDPFLGAEFMKSMMWAYRESSRAGVLPPLQVAKHFIANTIENARTSATAYIDERTLFEVYYPPFLAAVEGGVSAIMCSYNMVKCTSGLCNGDRAYACGNDDILNKHLKGVMGFKGIVMSDWDATKCQPAGSDSKGCSPGGYVDGQVAAAAGLDLEMPACMTMRGGTSVNAKDRATRMWWAYLVQGRRFDRSRFGDAMLHRPYVSSLPPSNQSMQERRLQEGSFCCWWPQPPTTNICQNCASKVFGTPEGSCQGTGTFCGGGGPAPSPVPVPDPSPNPGPAPSPNPSPSPAPPPGPAPAPVPPPPPLPDHCPDQGGSNYQSSCKLQLAGRIVAESTTVLKNVGSVLPLKTGSSVALIGEQACASDPLAIAGGSGWNGMACQDVHKVNVRDGMKNIGVAEVYCPDQGDHGNSRADSADVVVAVVVPSKASEGSDRSTLQLKAEDAQLIRKYANAGKKVVVAMNAPGPMITSTWDAAVVGLIVSWLPGVANGNGIAQALFDNTYSASGRLPVTFPKCSTEACSIQDERASVALGNDIDNKAYYHHSEKALIGYRWYHAKNLEVSYPFGFGLFAYGRSQVNYTGAESKEDGQGVKITCQLKNVGEFPGKDVPQLYLSFPKSVPGDANSKPEWVLKGFKKVPLVAGSSESVSFPLSVRDLSYWDDAPGQSKWVCATGDFKACIGANSRDALLLGQGTCVTFASPCGKEDKAKVVVKQFDSSVGSQLKSGSAAVVGPAFGAGCCAIFLVSAALLATRRRLGSGFVVQSVPSFELLEEQPASRTQSFVE